MFRVKVLLAMLADTSTLSLQMMLEAAVSGVGTIPLNKLIIILIWKILRTKIILNLRVMLEPRVASCFLTPERNKV